MRTIITALVLALVLPAAAFELPGSVDKAKDAAKDAQKKVSAAEQAKNAATDQALADLTRQLKAVQNDKGPIVFKKGKAVIDIKACETTMKTLADIVNNYPGTGYVVQVEGYTDNTGSAKANKKISQLRAQAVKSWLQSKGKVSSKKLTAKGFGPENPIADNSTPEGQAKNRRVDFSVFRR